MLGYAQFTAAAMGLILLIATLILLWQIHRYLQKLPDDDEDMVKDDKYLMRRLRTIPTNLTAAAVLAIISVILKIVQLFL